MKTLISRFIVTSVLCTGLVACTSKKPTTLLAAPTSARPETVAAAPVSEISGSMALIPGSQEDLRASAGTDTVLFGFDSFALDAGSRQILLRQAAWLKRNPTVRVVIEGHCDQRGTREYNLALGDRRATSARDFLVAQGIAPTRLSTISYGKERPPVEGDNEAAWALNRRAATIVTER